MIKMLVGYGMNINAKSGELTLCNCPLHDAAGKGELTMVDTILELEAISTRRIHWDSLRWPLP